MISVGIAGAGLLGRLLAWRLAHAGAAVSVFDPAPDALARQDGRGAAAFTAAGMLSPLAEQECGGAEVAALGWRSIALWRDIATELAPLAGAQPLFRRRGSLLLAHGADRGAAERVLARLRPAAAPQWAGDAPPGVPDAGPASAPQPLDRARLAELEPALAPTLHAWLLPGEAQILPAPLLEALAAGAPGVRWHWGTRAERVEPGCIRLTDGHARRFDWVVDVRGVGARPELPVRGVRGELVWLHAPGVPLARPLRLLHPRHRVYLVPRPGDLVVLGASEIESEDRSPVSLKTAVELMAAAHSVIPALAEARIVHLETNLRPALPDNLPLVQREPGLLRINGLFRHGWLLAPALVEDALEELPHA